MRGSKSSANSPRSKRTAQSPLAFAGVVLLLAATGIAASAWCFTRGYTLYDGDAESHLDIARRVFDSRTPGPEQLGTVWLPFPHLLMIPFAMRDTWWHSGAAAAIPSCACFILAGCFLFASARRMYGSAAAGLAVALLLALNPNLLYLQSTSMTEPVQMAAVAALLWATLWFRDAQSLLAALAAAVASNVASMTRYESWFLIPFVSLYLLVIAKRKWHAIAFMALAAIAPLAWLAHNQFYNGNALEFYNGPYSAIALLKRQAAQGLHYPTDHNWSADVLYYRTTARLVVGRALLIVGLLGALVAIARKAWWPLAMLALVPLFFIWSLHSGGAVITLPQLGPWSLYDTRYAIAVLPLAALAAGAWITLLPVRWQISGAIVLAALVSLPMWLSSPICWQEAQENSEVRRAWTGPAAEYLAQQFRPGSGVIFTFGSGLAEVLRRADIPLREGLHEGNGPAWDAVMTQPEKFLHEEWALAIPGDSVSKALLRAQKHGLHYDLRRQIVLKGTPMLEIYQRDSRSGVDSLANPLH